MDYEDKMFCVIEELRAGVCDDQTNRMCPDGECPKLYKCPFFDPIVEELEAAAMRAYQKRRRK